MFHYQCDRCEYSLAIDYIPREYVFDDGRTLPMLQRHIWCNKCMAITVAESFDEAPETRRYRLERYEKHKQKLQDGSLGDAAEFDRLKKQIAASEEFERSLRDWQTLRSRPPHCLKCGNEQIAVATNDWDDIQHQECGGTLKCTMTIIGGTIIPPEPHKYSVEGELIEIGFRHGPFEQGPLEQDKPTPLELWWTDAET